MTLGENLQKLRAAKGLSQQDVARTLYVSRQSVSKWENDAAEPGVENLKALAKLFGVTLDRLLLAEVPKRQPPEPERPPYSGKLEWSLLREGEQARDQARWREEKCRERQQVWASAQTAYWVLVAIRTVLVILLAVVQWNETGDAIIPFAWFAILVGLGLRRPWLRWLIIGLEGASGLFALFTVLDGREWAVLHLVVNLLFLVLFLFWEKLRCYFKGEKEA